MQSCPACGYSLIPLIEHELERSFCPRCGARLSEEFDEKTLPLENPTSPHRAELLPTLTPKDPDSAAHGDPSLAALVDTTIQGPVGQQDDFSLVIDSMADEPSIAPESDGRTEEDTLAGHKLKKILGKGGMGVVHLAHEPGVERDVALKVLLPGKDAPTEDGTTSAQVARFIEEAQVSGQLQHPGVIPVYRLGRDERGRYYYTMRPITEGRTLRDIINELKKDESASEKWSIRRLVEILRSVCLTVAYAHKHGALHRDLKPGNIAVGDYGEVLVMDWGLTKVFDPGNSTNEAVEPTISAKNAEFANAFKGRTLKTIRSDANDEVLLTMDGAIAGTPAYMSPEQASAESQKIGPATDIYALGAILYEILTLTTPYEGDNLMALLYAIWIGNLESPFDRAPNRDIPDELALIARRALSVQPEGRHKYAEELGEDLRAWLEGRPRWRVMAKPNLGANLMQWTEVFGETEQFWRVSRGVLEATDSPDSSHTLLYKEPFSGDMRMSCTAWCEQSRPSELSINLCSEDPKTVRATGRDGYCLQFGADDMSVTKLARNQTDVATVVGRVPVTDRKYALLAEAAGGEVRLLIDGEEVIRWKDPRPLRSGHVGFYAWGAGAKFTDIVIEARGRPVSVPVLEVPDSHFLSEHYEDALRLYREIAASHPDRDEGTRAKYGSGLCLVRLGSKDEAREVFAELKENQRMEPYGVLGEVRLIEEEDGEECAARHLLAITSDRDLGSLRWRVVAMYAMERAVERYRRGYIDKIFPIWLESAFRIDRVRRDIVTVVSPHEFRRMLQYFVPPRAGKVLSANPDVDDLHTAIHTLTDYCPEGREDGLGWIRQARFVAGYDNPREVGTIREQILSITDVSGESRPQIEPAIAELAKHYPSLPHLAHHLRRDLRAALRSGKSTEGKATASVAAPPKTPIGREECALPRIELTEAFVAVDLESGEVSQYAMEAFHTDDRCKTTRLVMKRISAGTFLMGDRSGKGEPDEQPVHEVTISRDFYLGVYPVTQRQWYEIMGHWPSHNRADRNKRPVENISWLDTRPFVERLSLETGLSFTLPTEAQWEYACRAGTETTYAFGNEPDDAYMWYMGNSGSETHEVGTRKANDWGLYDMHGNVLEWCLDWRGKYTAESTADPRGAVSGGTRGLRGGCSLDQPHVCRSARRAHSSPRFNDPKRGFRLALEL